MSEFERFWASGPWRRLGKKQAERHWNSSVKTPQDLLDIQLARDNYRADLQMNRWKKPQHGSTWFNNWRDWVAGEDRTELLVDEADPTIHICRICDPAHEWRSEDPFDGASYELACPTITARYKVVVRG